jgi:DNA (cytosine-5)-methyltransferase 1
VGVHLNPGYLNQLNVFTCSKMYLKTEFAWYILDTPAKLYQPYFVDFWLKHRVLHLLVTSALANASITLAQFFQSPEVKRDTSIISHVLGRPLSKDDILAEDTVRLYILILHMF